MSDLMAGITGASAPATAEKPKRGRSVFWKQKVMGYTFLAPTVILFLLFTILPLILSFYYAFTDYNLIKVYEMVGFKNFKDAFENVEFMRSFLNVLIYAIMVIPLSIVSALLAAVLVNSKVRGVKVYRVLFYIPAVTSGVAVAYMWKWMFSEEQGLFNAILKAFGLPITKWISSPSYFTMFCVAIVSAWTSLGGNMLIFLAALKGVSPELYEAANVDGANAFQKLTKITIPSIAPTMFFILTMSIIGAFQLFDLVYIMVPEGLPETFARTPVMMIYQLGFHQFEAGYGTAMSIILFAVIMIATFIMQAVVKEDRTV